MAPSGCLYTPKDCNDNNPCTIDTCVNGICQNKDGNFCDDHLHCTDNICKPNPLNSTRYLCLYPINLTNCGTGPVSRCQKFDCGYNRDCKLRLDDSLCPQHTQAPACMEPKCTDNGCKFKDICSSDHPDCKFCSHCSCNLSFNKCFKSCTKRSLENELTEDMNENNSTGSKGLREDENGGHLLSVGITNLFFILCLIYMINKL